MSGDTRSQGSDAIGWPRAIVSSAIIVVVGSLALVYAPNLILRRFDALSRGGRVAVVCVWFFAGLGLLAWTLRRLQAHGEI